jgi:hypothetical protein
MPKSHVDGASFEVNTTAHVRTYLEQLMFTGLYGKSPGEVAERLIARAIRSLIRRGKLPVLPPMQVRDGSGDAET